MINDRQVIFLLLSSKREVGLEMIRIVCNFFLGKTDRCDSDPYMKYIRSVQQVNPKTAIDHYTRIFD